MRWLAHPLDLSYTSSEKGLSPVRQMEPEQFGPYTLVRHLATGGMGELFLAQRAGLAGFSKQLVVKRIRAELADDREFVDMFLAEGRIAALLDHPNVVHIYDLGQVAGIYYLAMEYVAGQDLGTILERNGGPLDLACALAVMISTCEGVGFAHDATTPDGHPLGLVHRDINPQNILISYRGSVSITDFGIAKVRSSGAETRAGVLKGKFGYLAPEQARSGSVDRRTDIYTLGLLLFEATIGKRAIPGRSDTELLYAAAEGITQRPTTVSKDYPPGLERIYLAATAKNPDARYQSVQQLQEDLVAFQMEHRLVVTSSRLAELVQRLFAGEWSEEHLTPTAAQKPQATMLKPPGASGPLPRPTGQPFIDAPTLHDFGGDAGDVDAPTLHDFGGDVGDAPTIHDFGGDDTGMATMTDLAPYGEADPAVLSGAPTDRLEEPPPSIDRSLAEAHTRLIDRRDEDQVLHGDWTSTDSDPDDACTRARWPIILISTIVTLALGGGAAYFFLAHRLSARPSLPTGLQVHPTKLDVQRPVAADISLATSVPLLDSGVPLPPDARVLSSSPDATDPDAALTRAAIAPDAAPRPATPLSGTLQVTCSPQVRVFWRGRDLGQSPLTITIAAGRQRLVLRNAQLGINIVRRVTVRAGGRSRLETEVQQGALLVKARPWAHVEIDGRRRGTTPMKPIKLYEGHHKVKLINTDKQQAHETEVVIRAAETTKLVHRF